MIKRIVSLCFKKENTEIFEEIFHKSKHQIRTFPGCEHLELCKDVKDERVYYTISIWDHEDSLEAYRKSPLFETTWAKTKILFDEKPMAFSLKTLETLT